MLEGMDSFAAARSYSPDFRRQLKGRMMAHELPVQIIKESTLHITPQVRNGEKGTNPLSDRLFVAEYEGYIYSFDPKDPTGKKDLFLDAGRGISAFSFHPKYKENGQIFVFSHAAKA